mgnify:CR=1 FL=1
MKEDRKFMDDMDNKIKKQYIRSKKFSGEIEKLKLRTYSFGLNITAGLQKDIKQNLTINDSGKVQFTSYVFAGNDSGNIHQREGTKDFKIEKTNVHKIFSAFSNFFINIDEHRIVSDIGGWELELTNTEGDTYFFCGSIDKVLNYKGIDLSILIRDALGMDNLLVFDGNYKEYFINKISIEYYRFSGKNYDKEEEGYLPFQYSEHFVIDKASESITHIQIVGRGCKISHKYEYIEEIHKLFEDFNQIDLFSYIEGNPSDVVENLDQSKKYKITIDYDNKEPYIISGSFDKRGLPSDFPYFVKSIFECTATYPLGEILNPLNYEKVRRRSTEYIYCSVEFENGYKSYYYLTDDDSIEVGNLVVVPVGSDNHEMIVEVVNVEYFSVNNVPIPIEKTKRIIRKY